MNNATSAKSPVFLPLRPKTLISLWEMIQFSPSEIWSAKWLLELYRDTYCRLKTKYHMGIIPDLLDQTKKLHDYSSKYQFEKTKEYCNHFRIYLEARLPVSGQKDSPLSKDFVRASSQAILKALDDEMRARKFAFIPKEKSNFFEKDGDKALFGVAVFDAFPEARDEIKDAGNCLAADLNTAAVFHLMRVAEIGLRKLAKPLKIKLSCQIEFATWGNVTTAIGIELVKTKSAPRSKARDKKLQHYSQLLLAIQAFQHLWRDPVSHLRGRYDELRARSAFNHVRTFMENLV